MKIGFSSFSFFDRMNDGRMGIREVIEWVAGSGADHFELATMSFSPRGQDEFWNIDDDPALLDSIRSTSASTGVELSGLCIPANFLVPEVERRHQIERAKHHIRLCDSLGIRFFRHDVVQWKYAGTDVAEFERSLPVLADSSREIAQFAAGYGIVTSVENHGFYLNASERVRRLILEVDEPNFRTTLDVGNFLCVDEDPLVATRKNLPLASFVHLKDFFIRPEGRRLDASWLTTLGGSHLLGSIVGFGDMPTAAIIESIVDSGFDGFVSIEFEGLEDSLVGCEKGLANTRAMLGALVAS
jgi:L-ribulose-5-phosphate 3-epimerase